MKKLAFTLVEVLITVTIIAILALVSTYAIRRTSVNSKQARKEADLKSILTAIESKRSETSQVLKDVTGSNCSKCQCLNNGHTLDDLSCQSKMQTTYRNLGFNKIPVDPWGRPYMVDENEYEFPDDLCRHDTLYSINQGGIFVPFYICPEY